MSQEKGRKLSTFFQLIRKTKAQRKKLQQSSQILGVKSVEKLLHPGILKRGKDSCFIVSKTVKAGSQAFGREISEEVSAETDILQKTVTHRPAYLDGAAGELL